MKLKNRLHAELQMVGLHNYPIAQQVIVTKREKETP